jgi:hypothetical protein
VWCCVGVSKRGTALISLGSLAGAAPVGSRAPRPLPPILPRAGASWFMLPLGAGSADWSCSYSDTPCSHLDSGCTTMKAWRLGSAGQRAIDDACSRQPTTRAPTRLAQATLSSRRAPASCARPLAERAPPASTRQSRRTAAGGAPSTPSGRSPVKRATASGRRVHSGWWSGGVADR